MKKVFKEVDTLDKRCYEELFLSEDILMEHAANALAQKIKESVEIGSKVFILCGSGNNGADGIACGRILHLDYDVSIMLPYGVKSPMSKLQLKRYKAIDAKILQDIEDADVYVDALFGSGLKRKLDDKASLIIDKINQKKGIKIACDIPSGIGLDILNEVVFKADYTICMGAYKLPLFGDLVKDFVGEIEVASLGVSREIYEQDSNIYLLEKDDLKLPVRDIANSNKGTYGHTSIICGDKRGASMLSAISAFNFGSGLVSLISEENDSLPPYLMQNHTIPTNTTSIAIGMGLGNINLPQEIFDLNIPLVVDADMFYKDEMRKLLEKRDNIVLTPHPKEFVSLLKICNIADIDIDELQQNRFRFVEIFSKSYPKATLVLKGANTIIANQGYIYINTFGTSALAKGGSGDVLSGMIAALLSQGYTAKDSAISGVLAHSLSANNFKGNAYSLNPLDICEGLKWL